MFILEDASATSDSAPAVNPNAGAAAEPEGGLPPNDPNGEGTTPEEVAKALKSSGMNITDEEEGDDPDAEEQPKPEAPVEEPDKPEAEEDKPKEQPDKPEVKPEAPVDEDKHSFTVEDASGVTYKITADADIEEVLKDFDPKSNGQLISILDQLREVKAAKASDDAQAAEDAVKAERSANASKILEGWKAEAQDLQAQKRIPAGEDGEARVDAVYKYMADENEKRMRDGKATLNSFEDALDKLENKEAREASVEQAKTDKGEARRKGALVGGSSAPASSGPPVYKAGSSTNANDALRKMGILK